MNLITTAIIHDIITLHNSIAMRPNLRMAIKIRLLPPLHDLDTRIPKKHYSGHGQWVSQQDQLELTQTRMSDNTQNTVCTHTEKRVIASCYLEIFFDFTLSIGVSQGLAIT